MTLIKRKKRHSFKTTDFRMTKSKEDFVWRDEKILNLPIVRWPDGSICQPLVFYFGWRLRWKRLGRNSMLSVAYTLREWLTMLMNENRHWYAPDDYLMGSWRQQMKDAGLEADRIEIKLRRVFDFYRLIPNAMPIDERSELTPQFTGPPYVRGGRIFPITTKQVKVEGTWHIMWSGSDPIVEKIPTLTVPDDQEVAAVCTAIRNKISEDRSDRFRFLTPERNWCMAQAMIGGGLRRHEVADFKISALDNALNREGIFRTASLKCGIDVSSILDISDNKEAQKALVLTLNEFRHQKFRAHVYVAIIGKGSKPRNSAFKIESIIDIITVGIWAVRKRATELWEQEPSLHDHVFLSFKTQEALLPGSIGDIMIDGFDDAGFELGGGHLFRKYYATMLAIDIVRSTIDNLGQITNAVLNTILSDVADALGHSKINTTTRHYVRLAMVHYSGLQNRKKRHKLMQVWHAILKNQDSLSDKKIKLLMNIVNLVARNSENSAAIETLYMVLDDPDLNNTKEIELEPMQSTLRIVKSDT